MYVSLFFVEYRSVNLCLDGKNYLKNLLARIFYTNLLSFHSISHGFR